MITIEQILTPTRQDAIASNMLNRMTPAARTAFLQKMTPRERREIEAAIARHSLRTRTRGTTWSTEKVRILTAGQERVRIVPRDHGGWMITTEDESLILTTDGIWTASDEVYDFGRAPLDQVWEDYLEARTAWTDQAAAVEALAAAL